jgi:hypothetical protein
MGDTKVSIKGLHEDMRIFASEVTEESKSATDRVKKLGKYLQILLVKKMIRKEMHDKTILTNF